MTRDTALDLDPPPQPAGDPAVVVRMLGSRDAALVAGAPRDLVGVAIDERRARALLDDPRRHLAAALVRDRIVGLASGVRHADPDAKPRLVVHDVAVAPGHRRRGIGRRLLATLLAHGREHGCAEARAEAPRDDAAFRRLCAAAGGVEVPDPVVVVSFRLG